MNYCQELAVDRFKAYVQGIDTRGPHTAKHDEHGILGSLEEYIDLWLMKGDGVEVSGGDYESFLKIGYFIVDAYFQDPSILDYPGTEEKNFSDQYERRVTAVITDSEEGGAFMDRHFFSLAVWRKLHGDTSEW